ncbi:uncharacterized protein [Physcomitrium patens]|uniref:uncharacterized protein n=1 Tax=Physcomitrium patens TaxID=3218 RepID=UPI003CCDC956
MPSVRCDQGDCYPPARYFFEIALSLPTRRPPPPPALLGTSLTDSLRLQRPHGSHLRCAGRACGSSLPQVNHIAAEVGEESIFLMNSWQEQCICYVAVTPTVVCVCMWESNPIAILV